MNVIDGILRDLSKSTKSIARVETHGHILYTQYGGFAIIVTAGENLAEGEVVQITQGGGADGKVYKNAIDSDMPMGVVYKDALADASVCIVVSGIAYVLPEAGETAVRGYVIYSSNATAGRVDQSTAIPAVAFHNREIGHFLDTGSGNGVKTRAVIHFN